MDSNSVFGKGLPMPSYLSVAGLAAILIGMSVTTLIAPTLAAAPLTYDPKPWLEDLEQTREALSTKYANLEWVVIEREIDLDSLFADAKAQLQSAASESDARAGFDGR
jgi:hypothetical protein